MPPPPWYNPILLAPAFKRVLLHDPVELPLAVATPAERIAEHAQPPVFGADEGAYIRGAPTPALVLCQTPIHREDETGEDPALRLARVFAPWLPDFHLLVHFEEHVRYTLGALEITELSVRGGRVDARRWSIAELVPRARWLGLRVGTQGFATEDELLLAVAARPGRPPGLLEHLVAVSGDELAIALEQVDTLGLGRSNLHNVPGATRRAAAVMALGGDPGLAHRCARLLAATEPFAADLMAQLRATRSEASQALPDAFYGAFPALRADDRLRRLWTTAGPGALGADATLFAPEDALRATVRAGGEPGWPRELVVVGEFEGSRLCLDTRWCPAPVVRELAGGEGFLELAADLYTFLDDLLPRS